VARRARGGSITTATHIHPCRRAGRKGCVRYSEQPPAAAQETGVGGRGRGSRCAIFGAGGNVRAERAYIAWVRARKGRVWPAARSLTGWGRKPGGRRRAGPSGFGGPERHGPALPFTPGQRRAPVGSFCLPPLAWRLSSSAAHDQISPAASAQISDRLQPVTRTSRALQRPAGAGASRTPDRDRPGCSGGPRPTLPPSRGKVSAGRMGVRGRSVWLARRAGHRIIL
jgi:hypothetical protein